MSSPKTISSATNYSSLSGTEEDLKKAAREGDTDMLYYLLRLNPMLLEEIDEKPFVDSPLHVAAAAGQTHFALEIMRLKPSFGKKLNPEGFSPLHLAVVKKGTNTAQRLSKYHPDLVQFQGKDGYTPLHYHVAESDVVDFDLLIQFLNSCPESIKKLTNRDETVFHIAVQKGRFKACKLMLDWLRWTGKTHILDWKDENGYPDESGYDLQEMIDKYGVEDHPQAPHRATWKEFLRSRPNMIDLVVGYAVYHGKQMSGETINAILVVATLVATTSYQAILQPPGGVTQGQGGTSSSGSDNSNLAGKVVMRERLFNMFVIPNTIAFGLSLAISFALLPLNIVTLLLFLSLGFTIVCYEISLYVISPHSLIPTAGLYLALTLFYLIVFSRKQILRVITIKFGMDTSRIRMARRMFEIRYGNGTTHAEV